jgi:putative transposase
MPDKFKNKYRIPSARASWWDYGSNAAYFITICTQNRKHYFGKIVESGNTVET